MINKLIQALKTMPSTTQLRLKQTTIFLIILVILVFAYNNRQIDFEAQTNIVKETQFVPIATNQSVFEDTLNDKLNATDKLTRENTLTQVQTNKSLNTLKKQNAKQAQQIQKIINDNNKLRELISNQGSMEKSVSVYPVQNLYPASEDLTPQIITPPKFIGEIIHQEFAIEIPKTKKLKSVRLPPSFMQGYLLTGMDALTLENENKPGPMMIRVQAPAVLPNSVKKDLKGCFVFAEGTGNLATHRVDARLVSLTCVNASDKSVISEKVKGYVQDSDGKRGLAGVVVHRAGSLFVRSMIAGAFSGIGSALSQSAQTSNLSSIGVSSTKIDGNGALGRSALGGALTSGSKNVSDLFLDLASQSSPIIEIGAGKHIDVIITELVTLQIQDL